MQEYEGFRVDRLKKVMEEHGASFDVVAEALYKNIYYLSLKEAKDYLNAVLYGTRSHKLHPRYIFVICQACNCTSDYLLGLSDSMW